MILPDCQKLAWGLACRGANLGNTYAFPCIQLRSRHRSRNWVLSLATIGLFRPSKWSSYRLGLMKLGVVISIWLSPTRGFVRLLNARVGFPSSTNLPMASFGVCA